MVLREFPHLCTAGTLLWVLSVYSTHSSEQSLKDVAGRKVKEFLKNLLSHSRVVFLFIVRILACGETVDNIDIVLYLFCQRDENSMSPDGFICLPWVHRTSQRHNLHWIPCQCPQFPFMRPLSSDLMKTPRLCPFTLLGALPLLASLWTCLRRTLSALPHCDTILFLLLNHLLMRTGF